MFLDVFLSYLNTNVHKINGTGGSWVLSFMWLCQLQRQFSKKKKKVFSYTSCYSSISSFCFHRINYIKILLISMQHFIDFGCEGLSCDTDNLKRSWTVLEGCLTTF